MKLKYFILIGILITLLIFGSMILYFKMDEYLCLIDDKFWDPMINECFDLGEDNSIRMP